MSPYFIEDSHFPYEAFDDGDLLYAQPDSDWDPEPLITAADAVSWEVIAELMPF
jgi:hypothetical protein